MSNRQTAITARQRSNANLRPFPPGVSGNPAGGASRARRELNADTIREMHRAFREGGRAAIDKVMKQSPAIFLKLLVLLVPRELEVTHSGGVKAMSDEQLEAGIEAIQAMLAAREAGENAKVINAIPENPEIPETSEIPAPAPRARRKAQRDVGTSVGSDSDTPIS
jgi:hypothetical protein